MQWANDSYIVQAADLVPANWVGRFFSPSSRMWVNVHGVDPPGGSAPPNLDLRSMDIRVTNATGGIKSGIRILVFCVIDGLHTGQVIPLIDGIQSAHRIVSWAGQTRLNYGLEWRIHQGALIAGDIVSICIGWEVAHG